MPREATALPDELTCRPKNAPPPQESLARKQASENLLRFIVWHDSQCIERRRTLKDPAAALRQLNKLRNRSRITHLPESADHASADRWVGIIECLQQPRHYLRVADMT